jgi:hypothetical protein
MKDMRNRKATTPISRKWLFLAAALAVVLVAAGTYAWYVQRHGGANKVAPSPTVNYSPATSEDNKSIDERKNQPLPTSTSTSSNPASPSQSNMAVKITGVNISAGNMHVGNLVSNSTAGSCTLTAAQSGQNVQQLATSSVHLDVNDYDCGAFNIPTSKFPGSGKWQLSLTVTNGSDKVTDTYDITIP